MARNLKTWTFQKAKEDDKLLYISGVPQKYWNVVGHDIEFTSFSKRTLNHHKTLTSKDQGKAWNKLMGELTAPRIVCIASAPSDHQAMSFAAYLAKVKLVTMEDNPMAYKAVRFVNSNVYPSTFSKEHPADTCSVVIIHNVMEDVPDDRLQIVRDYLTNFPDSLRVLVVGSMSGNPIDFMWDRLRLDADLYFGSTEKIKHTTVI